MSDMLPCPFCNSDKLKLEKKSVLDGYTGFDDRVEKHTYSVRCNVCHARGPAVGGRIIHIRSVDCQLPSWATTDEALKKEAIALWNLRGE